MSTEPERASARLATLYRKSAPPEQIADARQCLKFVKGMDIVRKLVDEAPPFTAEQRLRIAAILCNPAGTDAP